MDAMRLQKYIAVASLAVCIASAAHARGYRIDQVPGGYALDCAMCHFLDRFTRLTVMGLDTREHLLFREDYPPEVADRIFIGDQGNVDWATLALIDSDGDGYTNGEELGDPAGLFMPDDPQPDFPFTRPDLPDDFPCGSGTIEGPEQCDVDAFGGLRCADFGWPGGRLTCRDDCTIDLRRCNTCGDGVVDPGEICDGPPPVEAVCPDGTVGAPACVDCGVDLSGCRPPAPDAGLDASVADGGGGEDAGDAIAADAGLDDTLNDAASPGDDGPGDIGPGDGGAPGDLGNDRGPGDAASDAMAPEAGATDAATDADAPRDGTAAAPDRAPAVPAPPTADDGGCTPTPAPPPPWLALAALAALLRPRRRR